MSAKPLTVAIVGAGGLARVMAVALSRSRGVSVLVAARRPAAAAALVRGRRRLAARAIGEAVASARVILLVVPDRAIRTLAAALAPMRPSWRGVVVLHSAGAYGPDLLAPLSSRGAATGVLHPLAAAGRGSGDTFSGAYARIEGAPAARAAARRLCALLGLVPLTAPGLSSRQGRIAYHAAASLASNDIVALLAASHGLLVAHGVSKRDALAALTRLAAVAVDAARSAGIAGALTGPVVRNDKHTLAAQLAALHALDPAAAEAHRALSAKLVDVAEAAGRLDRRQARGLARVLGRGPGRPPTV